MELLLQDEAPSDDILIRLRILRESIREECEWRIDRTLEGDVVKVNVVCQKRLI